MIIITPPRRSCFWVGGAAIAAVVLASVLWAATWVRGPDTASAALPVLAEHPIQLPDGRTVHVQKYEVSVAEWNACHDAGACSLELRTRAGFSPETQPATGIHYEDVTQYIAWITATTGHDFRLPTAAEWAFMAQEVLPEQPDPIFTDPSLTWASAYLLEGNAPRGLKPSGGFSTTAEGIADLDGSVWEWTSDCYDSDIPTERCPAFFVGGEHVAAVPYLERDPARGGCAVGAPPAHLGMRLVSDTRPAD